MRWVMPVVVVWILLIAGIILYNNWNVGKSVPLQPEPIEKFTLEEIENSGPEVGDTLEMTEPPAAVITRFLQYVNAGDVDLASGLIEPNVLLNYSSSRKDVSAQDAVKELVSIFPAGSATEIQVGKEKIEGQRAQVQTLVVTSKQRNKLSFDLVQLGEPEDVGHGAHEAYWFIVSWRNEH